mmetsp:Transcript_1920/g.4252  ORF Transcript_1920/g.4252 Transcript_1920/m.4252 type:complete len:667 (-) Transcript_1920:38-2038(-)
MQGDLYENGKLDKTQEGETLLAGYNADPDSLPIAKYALHILHALENNDVVIVLGETGCGKSTQIPKYLYEAGWTLRDKLVGIVLPRRMAVISLASRVSQELRSDCVGYKIRFDDRCSENTKIKFISDGAFLRELLSDPLMTRYSVLVIDDAHERSLNSDLVMALVKKIRKRRPDLKVIISSASVDAEALRNYYSEDRVQILSVQGRTYPVDVFYLDSPCQSYIEAATEAVLQLHETVPPGDFLVFLTGVEEIEKAGSLLREARDKRLEVLPLHASLPIEQQMEVFRRPRQGWRRVVLSTNIAESSVTLEGVYIVIDCCFVKLKCYDPRSGIESLVVVAESQSQAQQRAGRAGRTRPGKCYRLCTETDFLKLNPRSNPEIMRSDLTPMLLYLKSLGIDNLSKFNFLDPPPNSALTKALEVLYSLGAIDDLCQLTEDIGYQLAEMPLEPRLGVILLNACKDEFNCSEEMLSIVSMLSVAPLFTSNTPEAILSTKKRLGCKEGDHVTLLNIYNMFHKTHSFQDRKQFCKDHRLHMRALQRAGQLREQLRNILRKLKKPIISCENDVEALLRCLTTGLFMNAAQRTKANLYKTVTGETLVRLMPSSITTIKHPQWVVYSEVLFLDQVYINDVSEIDADWLSELAPHYFQDTRAIQARLQHKRQATGPGAY